MLSEKRRTLTVTTAMQCEGTGVTQDRKPWETDLGRDPKDKYESKPIKDKSLWLLRELDSAALAAKVDGVRHTQVHDGDTAANQGLVAGQRHGW